MTTRYLQLRGVAFGQVVATSSALNLCLELGGSVAFQLVSAGASTPSSATATCRPAAVLLGGGAVSGGVAGAHRLKAASLSKALGPARLRWHSPRSTRRLPGVGRRAGAALPRRSPRCSPPPRSVRCSGPSEDLVGDPVVRAEPATWQRLALNALLVPLLEPDGPLSRAAPNEVMPCRESAEVRLNGKPVPHGQPLSLHRPRLVRLRLDDCWPLGSDWIGLFGIVEMTIVLHGARVTATVRPHGLGAVVDGARVPLHAEFVAEISLVPERRP